MGDWFPNRLDIDAPVYPPMKCCICGEFVSTPTSSRMCSTCLTKNIDLSQDISTHCSILQCCSCSKFYHDRWLNCELESKELLSVCLKKIKGLDRVKVVDAKFNWTEPHSRRLKIQLVVQKEVENNCIVEQMLLVEFSIRSTQCNNCKQLYTPHTWKALVQIRQKTKDKKHILLLEQIILKHNAHENVLSILSRRNGFDLHFGCKMAAQKFVEFVSDKIVSQIKNSKKLVTADVTNNKYNYKYTLHVSLIPICTDDLVFLTPKVASMYGGVSPFLLCLNITSTISLIDPFSLRRLEIPGDKYWKYPFNSLFNKFNLREFIVLNIERDYSKKSDDTPFELVDVEVMAVNSSKIIYTKSHLGKSLNVGSTYYGYDIRKINLNGLSEEETEIEKRIPFDVILIRKTKKRQTIHNWVLKRIFKNNTGNKNDDLDDDEDIDEDELLDFKDEIMHKKELQKEIDFYRNPKIHLHDSVDSSQDDPSVDGIITQLKDLSLNDEEYF